MAVGLSWPRQVLRWCQRTELRSQLTDRSSSGIFGGTKRRTMFKRLFGGSEGASRPPQPIVGTQSTVKTVDAIQTLGDVS